MNDRSDLVRFSNLGLLAASCSQLKASNIATLGTLVSTNAGLDKVHELLDDSHLLLLGVLNLHVSKSLSIEVIHQLNEERGVDAVD